MKLAELPAPEVARRIAAGHAVLMPMGSTETHGPALPMGDYLLAEAIALLYIDEPAPADAVEALKATGLFQQVKTLEFDVR